MDLCQWETGTTDYEEKFVWERKNSDEISDGNEGPATDHLDNPLGYFAYLSANHRIEEIPLRNLFNKTFLS